MKVILLAAGVGRRFGRRTRRLPKCLIPLDPSGENLLSRYLDCFRKLGLKDVLVVCGHQKEKIMRECRKKGTGLKIHFLFNRDYRKGSVLSLYRAAGELRRDCLIMDADVYFPPAALKRLLDSRHRTCFLVDTRAKGTGEEMMLMARAGRPYSISKKIDPSLKILGESVGFLKIEKRNALGLRKILGTFVKKGRVSEEYEAAYDVLLKKCKAGYETMDGFFWTEMDFEEDFDRILSYQE